MGIPRARKWRYGLFAAATITALATGTAMAAATSLPATDRQVSYLGLTFTVPADWPVIDLSATTCVRFDQHAVYLGTPGQQQDCPAHLVGRTEALVVQPATSSTTTSVDDTASAEIAVTTPTVTITAPYNSDRATVAAALASAGLPAPTPKVTTPAVRSHAALQPRTAVAALPATATDGTGQGFDACSAPSTATLATMKATLPYTNVGVYIGGSDTSCAKNFSASWVSTAFAAGWHFLPVWVGPQAEFGQDAALQTQGGPDADAAVTAAQTLGFPAGSVLYADLESYAAADRGPVMAYEAAWVAELHKRGYHAGLYGSSSSGITDLVHNYGGLSTPDAIWTAHFNSVLTPTDPVVPAADFANHQQSHQLDNKNIVVSGATVNIDEDDLDVALAGAPIVTPDSGLLSTPPVRLLDTRNGTGVPKAKLGANATLHLPVTGTHGVPSSVTSLVLNVTVANSTAGGVLTVFPDGQAVPTASNLNFVAGQTVANLVTVPVIDGSVAFHNLAGTVDVLADLFGYYTTAGGQTYHAVTPTRALDTRNGTGGTKGSLGARKSLTLNVAGVAGIPATVSAVIMNLTAANSTAGGFLTAFPSNEATPPIASNLNFAAGQTRANLVMVPVTNGSVKIYNGFGTVSVIADVVGYFTPDVSAQFTPTSPTRLLDTRNGTGTAGKVAPIGPGGTLRLAVAGKIGIPADVSAVVLNVTVANGTAGGFLTVFPDGEARPGVSSVNFGINQVVPNLVVVPVVNGTVDFFNLSGKTNAIADIAGYFAG